MTSLLDKIGEILWFAMFFTPVVTIPIVWRRSKQSKVHRVLIGLAIAFLISVVFFIISWTILLRDGLGPT